MACRSGSALPLGSLKPLPSSSLSTRPSRSVSRRLVLKTMAAHDRQSYGELLPCVTEVATCSPKPSPVSVPGICGLTSKVGFDHPRSDDEGDAAANGLVASSTGEPAPVNRSCSLAFGAPLPTMCVRRADLTSDDWRNPPIVWAMPAPGAST